MNEDFWLSLKLMFDVGHVYLVERSKVTVTRGRRTGFICNIFIKILDLKISRIEF